MDKTFIPAADDQIKTYQNKYFIHQVQKKQQKNNNPAPNFIRSPQNKGRNTTFKLGEFVPLT